MVLDPSLPISAAFTQSNAAEATWEKKWLKRICSWTLYINNVVLSVCVLALLYVLEVGGINTAPPGFYCNDPKLSIKFKHDTVPWQMLYATTLLFPLLIIFLVEIVRHGSLKLNFLKIWMLYKQALTGIVMTIVITDILKIYIGEPRPQFFDICKPDANEYCKEGTYVAEYNCTSTRFSEFAIQSSMQSFPSGHSSMSTFIALYSAYIIESRMPVDKIGSVWKSVLIVISLWVGIFITSSRVTDGRHHWWDALSGVIIGTLMFLYILVNLYKKTKIKS